MVLGGKKDMTKEKLLSYKAMVLEQKKNIASVQLLSFNLYIFYL